MCIQHDPTIPPLLHPPQHSLFFLALCVGIDMVLHPHGIVNLSTGRKMEVRINNG